VRAQLREAMFEWSRLHHNCATQSPVQHEHMIDIVEPPGILNGVWDEDDLETIFGKRFADRM